MKFRPQSRRIASAGGGLDVTPIVDVVFNLLIFFAVTLNFAVNAGLDIKLPSAASAKPVETKEITINLTKDGNIFYNDTKIEVESLAPKLRAIENKKSVVVIRADGLVPHGKVVKVIDIAKSEGLSRLAIATDTSTNVKKEKTKRN